MFGTSKPKLFRQFVKSVTGIPHKLKNAKSSVATYVTKKMQKLKRKKKPKTLKISSPVSPISVTQECVTKSVNYRLVSQHVTLSSQVMSGPVQLEHVLAVRKVTHGAFHVSPPRSSRSCRYRSTLDWAGQTFSGNFMDLDWMDLNCHGLEGLDSVE